MRRKEDKPSYHQIITEVSASTGTSPEKVAALLEEATRGIEAGTIRTSISCTEARAEWFTMAWNIYVYGGAPRFPIDLEVGIHMGECTKPECNALIATYWTVLKPSRSSDSTRIAEILSRLESKITPQQQEPNSSNIKQTAND